MARFYLSPTPSNTPSNTPTITPSNTECPITPTLTRTPTTTITPSPTTTITPSPIYCWDSFTISGAFPSTNFANGIYQQLTTYSGGSLDAGWVSGSTPNLNFYSGTATDGNDYRVFGHYDGTFYYTYMRRYTVSYDDWCSIRTTGNYFPLGGTIVGFLGMPNSLSATTPDGVYYYPIAQTYTGFPAYTLTRGSVCPTPTPTQTSTLTPTPTTTSTPTPTFVFYSGVFCTGLTSNDACICTGSTTLYSSQPFFTSSQQVYTNSTLTNEIPIDLYLSSGATLYQYQYTMFLPGLELIGACVTPTPTVTPTTTLTPTPTTTLTSTPTPTLTPTNTPSGGPAFDSDAATYLAAVLAAGGTLNSTISGATNTLFTDLKTNGLYTKLFDFYPIVGSSASAHSINAKSPGTYPIVWGGSNIVHSYSGFTLPGPSGGGGYGRFSGLSTSDIATTGGDVHISQYIWKDGTAGQDNGYDLCASDANNSNQNYIIVNFNGATTTYYDWQGSYNTTISSVSTTGYWNITRNAADTQTVLFKNGSQLASPTDTIYYCTTDYFIGAEPIGSNNIAGGKNSKGYNFFTFGNRLSVSEEATLSTIINTFQTSLGRNTY